LDYLPQIAAIGLLLLWPVVALRLQRVRSLAYPENIRCRVIEGPPPGYGDLLRSADAELSEQGFERFAWLEADWGPGYGPPRPFCVYRHGSDPTEVAVFLPEDQRPNVLRFSVSTELASGAVLQSFGYDPRSAATSTDRRVRRSVPTDSVSELLAAHRAWVLEIGEATVQPSSSPEELAADEESSYAEMLAALVDEGRLRQAQNGRLKPPRGRVNRLLAAEDQAPKPPADTEPVPLHRQAAMLAVTDATDATPPPRQWGRFVLSGLAFAWLGGLFWGWESAAALLAVVAFHELGHFLAMRRFGYRHVRMLLIPLLGGVATGVESDPSGTRRAVVSLAGPLPGIVLGWILLAAYVKLLFDGSGSSAGRALSTAAFALLGLNYLNLLPIPPLDGGRVLEAMIPRNWVAVERVVMGLAAAAGLMLAWALSFPLLALLVFWQLVGQRRRWADRRLADRLAGELEEEGLRCPKLELHLLKALATEGVKEGVGSRVERARSIRNLLKVRPPGRRARLAIGAIYAAVFAFPFLVVPQAAERLSSQLGFDLPGGLDGITDRFEGAEAEAVGRSTNDLLAAVAVSNSYRALLQCGVPEGSGPETPEAPQAPAAGFDEAGLDAAEARLGVELPEEYRRMALLPAAPGANLRAPAELTLAGSPGQDVPFDARARTVDLSYLTESGEVAGSRAPVAGVLESVVISSRLREVVLLKVGDDPALDCCRVMVGDLDGGLTGYPSVRSWLEGLYPAARESARLAGELVDRNREALAETAGLDLAALVDLTESRVKSYPREAWVGLDRSPVDDRDLAELDLRLETTLPDDYKSFLRIGNGLPQLELLPASSVRRAVPADWPSGARGERRTRLVAPDGRIEGDFVYPEGARERSVVIASLPPVKGVTFDPSAVLVPDGGAWRYVNLQSNCAYASFEHYLRAEYARQRTYDTGPSRPASEP
jgi:Zn-dependent protease